MGEVRVSDWLFGWDGEDLDSGWWRLYFGTREVISGSGTGKSIRVEMVFCS